MAEAVITPMNNSPAATATAKAPDMAGDAPKTFDELQAAIDGKKAEDRKAKKEAQEAREPKGETKDKPTDISRADSKGKEAKSKDKEPKESKDKEEDDSKKEEPKPKKTLKYKKGEDEAEIDEDAMFTHLINGQEVQVSARDLLNNYSGKTAWDKKFSEVDRKAKDFEGKYSKVQQQLKGLFEEQDPEMRIWKMAEVAGMNPIQFKKFYLDDNISLVEKYYSMTDEERDSYFLQEENKYLRHKNETVAQAEKTRQAQAELSKKLEGLRQAHQVSEDDFWSTYESIAAVADDGKLEQDGIKSAKDITPEKVIEIYQKEHLFSAGIEAMKSTSIKPELQGNALKELVDTAFAQGLKPQDIPDMISEIWGVKRRENKVAEKVKEREEFISGKKEVATPKTNREPMFFSDL
ncbi:MAG TPA: hypothetical protein VIG33_14785 [Pseudobdellovibrionaceae bacterium]|jgi:hypothetical protein